MAGLLIVGFLVVAAAVVAVAARHSAPVPRAQPAGGAAVPIAVRRHTAIWRWSGIAAGVLAAGMAALSGALGRGLLLAAPLFGVFVLAGVLAGELSVRAPGGRTRRAAIAVRRAGDYIPRGLACSIAVAAVAMGALLIVTTATGTADDLGSGRSLVRRCSAVMTQSDGPWAGSFYSIPLAIVILGGLTAAVFALRQVVRRPRPGDPATLAAADDLLRHRAARTITGACGVLVTIPLIGVSVVTAGGLLGITCRPTWWTVAAWSLFALVPGWTAVLAWSGLAVLAPQRLDPAAGT
jgi:hypothetical protein